MNQKISEYLYEKGNITRLIIYTALFALVFINIYQPFDSRNWFPISEEMFLVFSSLVILTGVLVVLMSRVIMYHYARRKGLFFWQYALWILAEIFAMAMFYTLFQSIILDDKRLFSDMLRQSIINTSLVLLLPYSILWLYFALKDRNKKLATLSNKEMEEGHSGKQMFNFRDEKKDLRFSVASEQVLWIEAADNYVKIHYQNKGKPATFMVRNTLKKIEDDFFSTTLVRCNRSVIVNFDRVKILRKEQEGFFLSLDSEAAPDILVSKTYADKVLMRFSEQYSG
ncbi:MAG: LytTR family transcriptional regulator [Mariniphaga sp.]|nr:LytTR family transcriptional regulator [Mariniphaga sp.]